MKRVLIGAVFVAALAGLPAGMALAGGDYGTPTTTATNGHTPVTICHKPYGAKQTLVVDDDAVQGHLDHGDYLGECQDEMPTETTTTTETETTTETQPTVPEPPCAGGKDRPDPPGGKDGNEGNDDCVEDPPDPTTPLVIETQPPTVPPVTTTPEPEPPVTTTVSEDPPSVEAPEEATPPKTSRTHTKSCPKPAYLLNGKCVRDFKGKPHPVQRGSG